MKIRFKGAANSSLFEKFIRERLAQNIRANDLLFMDNAKIHHADIVKRMQNLIYVSLFLTTKKN